MLVAGAGVVLMVCGVGVGAKKAWGARETLGGKRKRRSLNGEVVPFGDLSMLS